MGKKNKNGADFISKIPKGIWLLISFIVAILVWTLLSVTPQTARCFPIVISVPVAFLMAWYRPVRYILEPWIQFIRNIPPLAYVPLVVIGVGVGRTPQIIVICLATFLIMTVTIFQGRVR